ncbi:MAG: glyoxalase/bleomycin resistance protein/dioxygenase [Halothiobacillaceae bacterium]|nr:MAG: glyoxalase/bleomycin resistance protein/dioxygenase [Halothiobacillaceae bacterium]
MARPTATTGLRHVALYCHDLEASERFYGELIGMIVEWRPDADNVYLTSGHDNLALHRAPPGFESAGPQRLDHIGFILAAPEHVDEWYTFFQAQGVAVNVPPRQHRDGARSFYCSDPDGNTVQMIYHPPLAVRG